MEPPRECRRPSIARDGRLGHSNHQRDQPDDLVSQWNPAMLGAALDDTVAGAELDALVERKFQSHPARENQIDVNGIRRVPTLVRLIID